jgi:hypothetical protein
MSDVVMSDFPYYMSQFFIYPSDVVQAIGLVSQAQFSKEQKVKECDATMFHS